MLYPNVRPAFRGPKAAILLGTLPADEDEPSSIFKRANQFGTPSDSQDIDLHLLQTTARRIVQYLAAPHGYLSFVRSGLLIKQWGPCSLHILPIKQVSWAASGAHLSVRSDEIPALGN